MWMQRIDNGRCDKGFLRNLSNCEYECANLCDIGEYSDYKYWKCRKRLIDKLDEDVVKYWWK